MKITSKLVLSLLLYSIFMMSTVCAAEQSPSDAPPKIENLNEDGAAITNLKKAPVKRTTQTIQNGQQTEVKVTNEIGTYIVKPNQSVGTSLPGDTESSSNHAVQWIVKSWGGSKNTVPAETPPTLQNNPDNSTNVDSK